MMFRSVPTLSFEHIARAFAKESGSPCLQAMNVPPGARSFLVAALSRRLGRPMRALFRLFRARGGAAQGMVPVVVCPVSAALEKTLPPEVFAASVFRVAVREEIDRDDLTPPLAQLGYARLPATSDPGGYSVRGGIVDVYSPAPTRPARISLVGDRVESIRWFDPTTQRTGESGEDLTVIPCTQVITRGEFLQAAAAASPGAGSDFLRQGIRYHGVDAMLPRLYARASSVFDHLAAGVVVVA